MGQTDRRLTAKEEGYCRGILEGLDSTAAWLRAYGKAKSNYAKKNAYKVSRRAHVIARLAELRRPDEQRLFLTVARKREILRNMAESKNTSEIGIQRAIDIDNRMTGVYTSKVELTGEITLGTVLDALAVSSALPEPAEVLELMAGDVVVTDLGHVEKSPAGPGQAQSSTPAPFADDEAAPVPPKAEKGLKTGLVKHGKRVYRD